MNLDVIQCTMSCPALSPEPGQTITIETRFESTDPRIIVEWNPAWDAADGWGGFEPDEVEVQPGRARLDRANFSTAVSDRDAMSPIARITASVSPASGECVALGTFPSEQVACDCYLEAGSSE